MNKSALKTFATSARKELLKKVEAKAMKIGITEDNIKKADIESSDAIFIDGRQLSKEEKVQRDKLIARINQIGFNQVMEEVAYTWFNRFTALRFMEVNDYLPTGVRVLSSSNPNSADPDMLNEALELDLEVELDKEHIYNLKLNNETEELFKYLIIKYCNDLNRFLPFMFEMIDDYTEILFPEGLLAKDSFIRQMTDTEFIPEDNWLKVEVIGWLYQYYIAEEKDRVIQAKEKYKTEEIPYATQLFTPDWIVRYMVQNSLGRYWVESHTEHRDLLENWEFYLENPNPESDFEEKLAPYINKELKVEDIKCFDPAMGSGHILVYMFDVLYEIYSKCGYMEREIPRLIIENNLYGLDIDDRAYQLACFSVVMKALEYNPRFFKSIEREGLELNLASIQETNIINETEIAYIAGESDGENYDKTKEFIEQFKEAKTFGTLIKVQEFNIEFLKNRLEYIKGNSANDLFEDEKRNKVLVLLPSLLKQAEIMLENYDILVSNPPYLSNLYMNSLISDFVKVNYPNSKTDFYACFIERGTEMVKEFGHLGFLSPFSWMFLSSFQKLREAIVAHKTLSSIVQIEYNAFEVAAVQVASFTMRNWKIKLPAECINLSDFPGAKNQPLKTLEAIKDPTVPYRHTSYTDDYNELEGKPIAYWISDNLIQIFKEGKKINEIGDLKVGLQTGDNERFLKVWHEVDINKISFNSKSLQEAKDSKKKWFPHNKGGEFRRYYGNKIYVVNWENDGFEIKNNKNDKGKLRSRPQNISFYFKEGITWSDLTAGAFSARYIEEGSIFDTTGPTLFVNDRNNLLYMLGYMNSKVFQKLLEISCSGMHYNNGVIAQLPVYVDIDLEIKEKINSLVEDNLKIAKTQWDFSENSWEFIKPPLLIFKEKEELIKEVFNKWNSYSESNFRQFKENEESLNEIFIKLYGLEGELTKYIGDNEIALNKSDLKRDIIHLLSYAVGCMFGRYSLDQDGVVFGGGIFDQKKYVTYSADVDNILPILSGDYFEDDIVSRFINFISSVYGENSITQNIDYIAEALGKKKNESSKEAIRRYFVNDFYNDHINIYSTRGRKAPIYWLFSSGKEKAFNCLIYMHRYDKTTLSRIRTDYLHEYQIRLDAEKKDLLSIIEGDYTTKEISNAKKELKALDKKIEELKEYDELLHHMADMQIEIDLDDGVKVNYEKFKGLVAKI